MKFLLQHPPPAQCTHLSGAWLGPTSGPVRGQKFQEAFVLHAHSQLQVANIRHTHQLGPLHANSGRDHYVETESYPRHVFKFQPAVRRLWLHSLLLIAHVHTQRGGHTLPQCVPRLFSSFVPEQTPIQCFPLLSCVQRRSRKGVITVLHLVPLPPSLPETPLAPNETLREQGFHALYPSGGPVASMAQLFTHCYLAVTPGTIPTQLTIGMLPPRAC